MRFLRFCSFFLLFGFAIVANGQIQNPGDDDLFRELEVTEIRLTMSASDKTFLLADENRYESIYVSATVQFTNSRLNGVSRTNVGVRLRGNTARGHDKRSYKIDFREYGGEKFRDHKKINLKPDVNDPTMARELLSMHIYRKMGVPAARVAPAVLYINGEFMGTYLILEQLDDEFLDRRFGHEIGFLYKCAYGATLVNNGQVYNGDMYESEMNQELDTRAELVNFVNALNTTSSANFASVIEDYFDVDMYLRQLAVEAILGHWDGYSYNKNNFYLYYNGQTGIFHYIPYDTDNTWGIDWLGQNWGTYDLESFYHPSDPRPLTRRILDVPAYEQRYLAYIGALLNTTFRTDYLYPLFDQVEALFDPWVEQDTYFNNAFNFSYSFFQNSFNYSTSGHVKYGLRGYVEARIAASEQYVTNINGQLATYELFPNPSYRPEFYISTTSTSADIGVFDLNGRSITHAVRQTSSGKWMVTLAQDQPGLYMIRVGDTTTKWLYR